MSAGGGGGGDIRIVICVRVVWPSQGAASPKTYINSTIPTVQTVLRLRINRIVRMV